MRFIFYFIIIFLGIFLGYENPELIEKPKKYIRYKLEQIRPTKSIEIIDFKEKEQNHEIYSANSFKIKLEKIESFNGLSAGLFVNFDEKQQTLYDLFTQDGFLIKKNKKIALKLPFTFYKEEEKNGGIKSIFSIKNTNFALISEKKINCYYVTIINLDNFKKIIETDCLPDIDGINFSGLGGAYVKQNNKLLISIGIPTHYSDAINSLSLGDNVFGKIIELDIEEITKDSFNSNKYKIFTLGHRNPQGLVIKDNKIYSLEHGPQGGDELNEIIRDSNYGWPIASFGTKYGNGTSYRRSHSESNFKEPIYTFLPSVAPSSINICPPNLLEYYKNYDCLIGLSLKEMSIIIFLLNENHLISSEIISLNKRLRHFGLDKKDLKLFIDKNDNFFITADNDGLYKVKFDEFR